LRVAELASCGCGRQARARRTRVSDDMHRLVGREWPGADAWPAAVRAAEPPQLSCVSMERMAYSRSGRRWRPSGA
jgi:hypothetical protein